MQYPLEEELLHTAEAVAEKWNVNPVFSLHDEVWGHIKLVAGKYYDELEVDTIDHTILLLCWCAIVKPEDIQ